MSPNCLRPRLPIVRQARNRPGKHHPFGNYCSSPALDLLSRARGAMIGYRIRGFARSLRSDPFLWHKRISAKKRLDPFRGFCVSAAMIGTFAKRFVIRNREMSMKTSVNHRLRRSHAYLSHRVGASQADDRGLLLWETWLTQR
jgi:hypothetical protein